MIRTILDLQRLVHNLIEVSRIEATPNIYNPDWIYLNDLLSDIQRKYSNYLESTGLTLDVKGDSGDVYLPLYSNLICPVISNSTNG